MSPELPYQKSILTGSAAASVARRHANARVLMAEKSVVRMDSSLRSSLLRVLQLCHKRVTTPETLLATPHSSMLPLTAKGGATSARSPSRFHRDEETIVIGNVRAIRVERRNDFRSDRPQAARKDPVDFAKGSHRLARLRALGRSARDIARAPVEAPVGEFPKQGLMG